MACVSSSGVVNTIIDFYAFDDHVATALQSPDPSADCGICESLILLLSFTILLKMGTSASSPEL